MLRLNERRRLMHGENLLIAARKEAEECIGEDNYVEKREYYLGYGTALFDAGYATEKGIEDLMEFVDAICDQIFGEEHHEPGDSKAILKADTLLERPTQEEIDKDNDTSWIDDL